MSETTLTLTHSEKLSVTHAVQQMMIQAGMSANDAERDGLDHAATARQMANDLRAVLDRLTASQDGTDIFAELAG